MGLGTILSKIGSKVLPSAGKAAGTGATLAAGGYGLSKGIGMIGKSLSETMKKTSSTPQGANDNRPLTGRLGMAGSAGRQSVSGGGTIPNFIRVPTVSVSKNDTQREMLETAIKLLSSIDASLKTQNQQQRFVAQQQAMQQRETEQERIPNVDAVIANKVGAFRSSSVGSTLEGLFNTALIGALAFGAMKMNEADAEARGFMGSLSNAFQKLGLAAIAIGAGAGATIGGVKAAKSALQASKEFIGPRRPGEAGMQVAKKAGMGALGGIAGKIGKGGLLGVAFEAVQYALGKEMTGRNIAGSIGTILGSGLGFVGGLGLGSVVTGIAGGYAGGKIGESLYDFFAGPAGGPQQQGGPQASGDVEKVLNTIRMRESGGNYSIQSKSSSASGAYQFIDSTWRSLTKKYSIGTQYSRAYMAPPEVQDQVARRYVEDILRQANGDVSKVPLVWYTGNIQGNMSARALAANNGLTPQEYQSRWMQNYNDPSSITSGGGVYGAQAMSSDMAMGLEQFKHMASQVTKSLKPTNVMTQSLPKNNQQAAASAIQGQAAAMEAMQRASMRGESDKTPPALTRTQIAKNIARNISGGAMSVPNPGYNSQGNHIDYLVYFGMANA